MKPILIGMKTALRFTPALSCLRHHIFFQARHIPGLQNSSADYISRSQVENFKAIFPEADENPTPLPENLMPKNWVLT